MEPKGYAMEVGEIVRLDLHNAPHMIIKSIDHLAGYTTKTLAAGPPCECLYVDKMGVIQSITVNTGMLLLVST